MPNRGTIFTLCVLVACIGGSDAQSAPKPAQSQTPLTSEQLTIYREFLADYDNGSRAILNVAQKTGTFEADEGDLKGCMKSFTKENSRAMTIHTFDSDAFPTNKIKLVDPNKHQLSDPGRALGNGQSVDDAVKAGFAKGLFTFSEIVFDNSHTHAALNYSFHCGSLCGHGGTVVFSLDHGKWKQSKGNCGTWIS